MKRSSNLENLYTLKENILSKIEKLNIQLKGIEKSISKIESSSVEEDDPDKGRCV